MRFLLSVVVLCTSPLFANDGREIPAESSALVAAPAMPEAMPEPVVMPAVTVLACTPAAAACDCSDCNCSACDCAAGAPTASAVCKRTPVRTGARTLAARARTAVSRVGAAAGRVVRWPVQRVRQFRGGCGC